MFKNYKNYIVLCNYIVCPFPTDGSILLGSISGKSPNWSCLAATLVGFIARFTRIRLAGVGPPPIVGPTL